MCKKTSVTKIFYTHINIFIQMAFNIFVFFFVLPTHSQVATFAIIIPQLFSFLGVIESTLCWNIYIIVIILIFVFVLDGCIF